MSNKVEFKPPTGFMAPEGTKPGDEFDLVCSFRLKPNGDICLVELGDIEMPGYSDSEDDSKPSYGEYAKSMGPIGQEQGGS